jgi:hypothetical protein
MQNKWARSAEPLGWDNQITVEQSIYIPLNLRNLCPQRSFRYRVFTGGQMILKRRFKPERRRRKRQLLNTSVQVFTESAQLDGLGINLSDVGMCLFTMANLQVGSQIQVEFLPPRSTEPVRVSGIVCHRALYLYGVDFLVDSDQHSSNLADVAECRTAFGG